MPWAIYAPLCMAHTMADKGLYFGGYKSLPYALCGAVFTKGKNALPYAVGYTQIPSNMAPWTSPLKWGDNGGLVYGGLFLGA